MGKQKKIPVNFRLSQKTIEQLKTLKLEAGESATAMVERSIDFYTKRKEIEIMIPVWDFVKDEFRNGKY